MILKVTEMELPHKVVIYILSCALYSRATVSDVNTKIAATHTDGIVQHSLSGIGVEVVNM